MTTPIKTRYKRLKAKIDNAYADIKCLQQECSHPDVGRSYNSSTGNYLNKDEYWIDFNCPDCGKWWREDQ